MSLEWKFGFVICVLHWSMNEGTRETKTRLLLEDVHIVCVRQRAQRLGGRAVGEILDFSLESLFGIKQIEVDYFDIRLGYISFNGLSASVISLVGFLTAEGGRFAHLSDLDRYLHT